MSTPEEDKTPDLASGKHRVDAGKVGSAAPLPPRNGPPPDPTRKLLLGTLAAIVTTLARQLFYEEQVCLLWVMYNCFSTTANTAELASESAEKARPQGGEQARAA